MIFNGSDVRSMTLMQEHQRETGLANIATYLGQVSPVFLSSEYEKEKLEIARSASDFADEIFTMRVDQSTYLERETQPYQYFLPDEQILANLDKFDNLDEPVIVHAPSSPIIKGTQLVRAAVELLKGEGYEFEYIELSGVAHEEVRSVLERAHLVLNQFYAHAPGVFGVEAMAAGCVVLMSADEYVEPDLPLGSNGAWVVTKHWQVYNHLRKLLDQPDQLRSQAEAAQDWVRLHAATSVAGPRFRKVLDRLTTE